MSRINKIKKISEQELGQLHRRRLDEAKSAFELLEFSAQNDDGSIRVIATGKRVLKSIVFGSDLLKLDSGVEEAIVLVVNEALSLVREANIELTSRVNNELMNEIRQLKKSGRM